MLFLEHHLLNAVKRILRRKRVSCVSFLVRIFVEIFVLLVPLLLTFEVKSKRKDVDGVRLLWGETSLQRLFFFRREYRDVEGEDSPKNKHTHRPSWVFPVWVLRGMMKKVFLSRMRLRLSRYCHQSNQSNQENHNRRCSLLLLMLFLKWLWKESLWERMYSFHNSLCVSSTLTFTE